MPTRRPLTPIAEHERGVLLSDAAREAEFIEGLMTLLPSDLDVSVTAALGRPLSADLRAALGGPETIVAQLASVAKEWGSPLDERKLVRDVEVALRELSGDSDARVDPSVVEEETEHAKHALVTHWLSMLITAWDLWDGPTDGLLLDPKTLLPDPSTCPRKEEWRDAKAALEEALTSSIALDPERDVPRALGALASNVYARGQRASLPLPRGLVIARTDGEVRLCHSKNTDRVVEEGTV